MAISFHNTYYDDIIENLSKIINDEFSIPVYFDEIKSNSFLLTPDSDDLVEYMSNGIQRDFNVNIIYELKQAGNYNKNDFKQVTNVMERLRRLIFNNSSYGNGSNWFSAKIDTVNYERDEDDPSIFRATALFNCQNIEVV